MFYGLSLHNFLLFHTLAELFAVVVAFAAFALAWHSRDWIGGGALLTLGIGQLFVGGVDLLHTLGYKGVGVLHEQGGNLSTQLWLTARALDAGILLFALSAPRRVVPPAPLFAVLGALSLAGVTAVFAGILPVTFIDGSGLTPFKVVVEGVLIAVFAAALWQLKRNRDAFDPEMRSMLAGALMLKVATELAFVNYSDLYGLTNATGHVLKIAGCWLLFRAIVETGLRRPQALVYGARERERVLAAEVASHANALDAVLNATLDPLAVVDADGRLHFASRAAEAFLGRPGDELVGLGWDETGINAELARALDLLCRQVHETGLAVTREVCLRDQGHCYEIQVSPLAGAPQVVAVIRDTSARKATEEQLKASLEENRVLMMEVHHRVKNNLQIVSSILQMQGWRVPDPELRGQFEEACGRILSLARVHEMLYKQESAASVDFGAYVHTLCAELGHMYGLGEQVRLQVDASDLSLVLDKAVPLALILHELVTNSMKHAFGEAGGTLRITLSSEDALQGRLTVCDDGKGSVLGAEDFNGHAGSLGLRMVGVLVKQIQGCLEVDSRDGTAVSVRFPL